MAEKPLGILIRQLRDERDLSQGQLAAFARVKRSWLSLVETGRRKKPERDRLERVAIALRIEPETLWAAAGYSVEPLPPRLLRSPEEVISELQGYIKRGSILVGARYAEPRNNLPSAFLYTIAQTAARSSVSEAARRFNVSRQTVRRTMVALSRQAALAQRER